MRAINWEGMAGWHPYDMGDLHLRDGRGVGLDQILATREEITFLR